MIIPINAKSLLSLLLLLLFTMLSGCATRPPALPEAYSDKLPWGAIDLDIEKSGKFTLRDSLGSALIKKANDHSSSNERAVTLKCYFCIYRDGDRSAL